ncbi:MAG: HEXXH motif-containing putative peptide modification protein [Vicinamibacterales bacterium]
MEYFAKLLHFRVTTSLPEAEANYCRALIEGFDESSAKRILLAPILAEVLRLGGDSGRIKMLLEAERADSAGVPLNAWSVMGDRWLGAAASSSEVGANGRDVALGCPRLICGIPVDQSLPAFIEYPSSGLRQPRLLDAEQTSDALRSLEAATGILERTYPLGATLFSELTSNLVLREDAARPFECWGASSGIAIGRIVVVNPSAADGPRLAEVLLHEAVHCAIDCAELRNSILSSRASSSAPFVPSPWSGNPLSPHALVHACVVWAVLLEYWSRMRSTNSWDQHGSERFRYILRGFDSDFDATIAPVRDCLSDLALRLVSIACESADHVPGDFRTS